MRRKIGLLVILSLVFFTPNIFAVGLPTFGTNEGVIILEKNSGDILYQQKQDQKFYPASTTKLMTALVAVENGNLDDTITVGDEIENIDADSSVAGLEVGETITLRELLYGLLLPSGNDAAETIAVNIGRKIAGDTTLDSSKAYDRFIKAMNDKAKELGMTGTNYVNPHGLQDANHYTTPADMLKLAEVAFSDDPVRMVTRAKVHEIQTNMVKHKWNNTNLLLYNSFDELSDDYRVSNDLSAGTNPLFNGYATSGKTGSTDEAGKCFVFEGEGNGENVIGVILDGDETTVFKEASATINALIKEYDFIDWTSDDNYYGEVKIENYHVFDGNTLKLKTNEPLISLVPEASMDGYTSKIKWDGNRLIGDKTIASLKGDVNEGDEIGEVDVYNGDKLVESTPIYAANTMQTRKWVDYLIMYWYITIVVLIIIAAILRIMYVDFMRKNKTKYKKIKIKNGNSNEGRSGNGNEKRNRNENTRNRR